MFQTSTFDVRNMDSRKKMMSGIRTVMSGIWTIMDSDVRNMNSDVREKILVMSGIWSVFTVTVHQLLMYGIWTVKTGHILDHVLDIVHIPDIVRCPEYGQVGLGYLILFLLQKLVYKKRSYRG